MYIDQQYSITYNHSLMLLNMLKHLIIKAQEFNILLFIGLIGVGD